jgi:hypothetical protein
LIEIEYDLQEFDSSRSWDVSQLDRRLVFGEDVQIPNSWPVGDGHIAVLISRRGIGADERLSAVGHPDPQHFGVLVERVGQGAVRPGANVEKQIPPPATAFHQQLENPPQGLELFGSDIAPMTFRPGVTGFPPALRPSLRQLDFRRLIVTEVVPAGVDDDAGL